MIVHLFGNTNLVHSVYAGEIPIGMTTIINCTTRDVDHHYAGAVKDLNGSFYPCHQVFNRASSPSGTKSDLCEIVLVPESEREQSLLDGLLYESHEKDQIVCVRLQREHLHQSSLPKLGQFIKEQEVHHA